MGSAQVSAPRVRARAVILVTVLVVIVVGGVLYYWLQPFDSSLSLGLQKLREDPLTVERQAPPLDWQSLKQDDWTIGYPPQFELHTLQNAGGNRTFLFNGKARGTTVDLTIRSYDSLVEKGLVSRLQEIAHQKGYEISRLEAVLLLEQTNNESIVENQRPSIVVERTILFDGSPAIQFSTYDSQGALTLFRTSFDKGGNLIDVTVFPKDLSASDPSMAIYFQMLYSLHFAD